MPPPANGTKPTVAFDLVKKWGDKITFSVSFHSHNEPDLTGLMGKNVKDDIIFFICMFGDYVNYINVIITPFNTDIKNIAQKLGGWAIGTNGKILCFKHLDYNFKHHISDFKMSNYRNELNLSIREALYKYPDL